MVAGGGRGPQVVTGGAGAIGAVLVDALLQRGHEVRVVDNLSSGRRGHLRSAERDPKFSLVEADLREAGSWSNAFAGASAVWHLAANPDIRRGTEDPRLDLEHGTVATFRVLEAARSHGVPKVLFSSSSVVYGYPTQFPTPEEYGPLLPQSLYGASKLASEGLLSAYAHCYGTRVFMFRFANIIGPFMTHGVIFDFFAKVARTPDRLEVLGDGHQAKSYLRTEECVDAMLLASDRANDLVNVFNLGTRDRISVREIAEKVVAATGGHARIDYTGGVRGWAGDVPEQLLSIDKIAGLGWRPKLTSAQAVDQTIQELVRSPAAPP